MSKLKDLTKKKVSGLKRVVFEKPVEISQESLAKDFAKDLMSGEILDTMDSEQLYEMIMLKLKRPEQAANFLATKSVTSDLIWENPLLLAEQKKESQYVSLMSSRLETVKGVYKCGCGGEEVLLAQKQTRSGDEGMTTFIRCVKCKKTWTES